MIDTNELRRLAQEAMHPVTKGRWMRLFGERTVYDRMEDGCRGIPVVSTPFSPPHPFEAACLDFIAAANPAVISELLDRLEAAEKERDFAKTEIARLHDDIRELTDVRVLDEEYRDRMVAWLQGTSTKPAPSVPEGWKLVPVEPTSEMVKACVSAARAYMQEYGGNSPQVMWAAMLAAAPEAKP